MNKTIIIIAAAAVALWYLTRKEKQSPQQVADWEAQAIQQDAAAAVRPPLYVQAAPDIDQGMVIVSDRQSLS
jgi:hypothetical protein